MGLEMLNGCQILYSDVDVVLRHNEGAAECTSKRKVKADKRFLMAQKGSFSLVTEVNVSQKPKTVIQVQASVEEETSCNHTTSFSPQKEMSLIH